MPVSPERSRQMSLVRGKGNKSTEQRFARFLRANRITGWRRHAKIQGRPDFTFSQDRIVVFIDGCFWHGCPKCGRLPKTNVRFWRDKIETNARRDRSVTRALRGEGWRVFRIWEHAIKTDLGESGRILRVLKGTRSRRPKSRR